MIRDFIQEVNRKKVVVKLKDIQNIKKYYLGLSRSYMAKAFAKDYILDPTIYNEKDIRRAIVSMGIDKHIVPMSGKIELSTRYIKYAMCFYTSNSEEYEFLSILYNIVKYREMYQNIDAIYDSLGFETKYRDKVSTKLVYSCALVYTKNLFRVDESYVKLTKGLFTNVEYISYDNKIFERAVELLGLPKGRTEGYFVKGLSARQEMDNAKLILNGLVKLDGKYSETLKAWLDKYKWNYSKTSCRNYEGLYDYILLEDVSYVMDMQDEIYNSILNSKDKVVSMDQSGFYCINPNSTKIEMPLGLLQIVNEMEDGISEEHLEVSKNILDGVTGEFYLLDQVISEGIIFTGCPIEINYDGKPRLVVDVESTDLFYQGYEGWYKNNMVVYEDGDKVYKPDLFKRGSIEDTLYFAYINQDHGSFQYYINTADLDMDTLNSAKKAVTRKMISMYS